MEERSKHQHQCKVLYMEGFHEQPKIQTSSFQIDERCVGLVLHTGFVELKLERRIRLKRSCFRVFFHHFEVQSLRVLVVWLKVQVGRAFKQAHPKIRWKE